MALATRDIAGLSPSLLFHFPPPTQKRNARSPFPGSKRGCPAVGCRLSWSGAAKRMLELARFVSNANQKQEKSICDDPSGDSVFSPDDADYLLKMVAGSVGGGAAIKYGSILFPDITRPNLVLALMMISLPVLVAAIILIE